MHENNPICQKMEIKDYPISILEELTPTDIEEYLYFLKYYEKDGVEHKNDERGIKRKLSSLRTFYRYFYKKEMIQNDPAIKVDMPKLHDKAIIRLDVDEVTMLLDEVESGESLTERQKTFHEKTKVRDLAMMTLLLGTGIRVSECVALDLDDLNFEENSILVVRKGLKEQFVYFNDEVAQVLKEYVEEERPKYVPFTDEKALFLSTQKRRISVRTIQQMVKKYSKEIVINKNLSPHKMRSTYGTALYNKTGDIRLVADVLGHSDINTTAKYYAATEDERRKQASRVQIYE